MLIFIETDVKENNPKKGKCTEKKLITIFLCQQQEKKNAFTLCKVREGKLPQHTVTFNNCKVGLYPGFYIMKELRGLLVTTGEQG